MLRCVVGGGCACSVFSERGIARENVDVGREVVREVRRRYAGRGTTGARPDRHAGRDAAKCENCVAAVMRVDVRLCLLLPHVAGHQGMSMNDRLSASVIPVRNLGRHVRGIRRSERSPPRANIPRERSFLFVARIHACHSPPYGGKESNRRRYSNLHFL